MDAHTALLDGLNEALGDELAAISQYMVQSEMNKQWGYERLHDTVRARAKDEMHHAEMLIERILFLGGTPTLTKPAAVHIGADIMEQIANDVADERTAFEFYNKLVNVAVTGNDKGTEELLATILRDEEAHLSLLEGQTKQIAQMGLENFLTTQVR